MPNFLKEIQIFTMTPLLPEHVHNIFQFLIFRLETNAFNDIAHGDCLSHLSHFVVRRFSILAERCFICFLESFKAHSFFLFQDLFFMWASLKALAIELVTLIV